MTRSPCEPADELLATIEAWRDRLLALEETTVRHKPTPDRWSIAEVVGHLVDSACNNHQRFIRVPSGDELTFPKYDQNAWVTAGQYHRSDWQALVQL